MEAAHFLTFSLQISGKEMFPYLISPILEFFYIMKICNRNVWGLHHLQIEE